MRQRPSLFTSTARHRTGELRSHKKDEEGNKQAPGKNAAGEVQCSETRSDNVADTEVCGADCRCRKCRHASGRHGWRTRGFGQFKRANSKIADLEQEVTARVEEFELSQKEDECSNAHVGE